MTPLLTHTAFLLVSFSFTSSFLTACSKGKQKSALKAERQAQSAGVNSTSKKPTEEKKVPQKQRGQLSPMGPRLVVLPGKGMSAIRLGATRKTVERHMGAACDSITESRCLYTRQALEFFFKDGEVERIKAHTRDRAVADPAANGDKHFGTFRGIVPPKIMMGLHRHIVLEEYGQPEKKEALNLISSVGLVERHFYDGLILEYDKIEKEHIVLAGIEVVAPRSTERSPTKK